MRSRDRDSFLPLLLLFSTQEEDGAVIVRWKESLLTMTGIPCCEIPWEAPKANL